MKMNGTVWVGGIVVLLAGCASDHPDRMFLDDTAIAEQARPPLLFPDYFLLDGFELHDHGRIPQTQLIGAGMSANLDLAAVRSRFNDVLFKHEWKTDATEIGRQSFRILASRDGENVEIRGVEGTAGPVQIFFLYTP